MKHDSCDPIPRGAIPGLILGSLAGAALTVGATALSAGCNGCHTPGHGEVPAVKRGPFQAACAACAFCRISSAPRGCDAAKRA